MVAVRVAAPAAVAVMVLPETEAPVVPAFFTDHAIALLVASDGDTVEVSVSGMFTSATVGTPEMSATAIKSSFSVQPVNATKMAAMRAVTW